MNLLDKLLLLQARGQFYLFANYDHETHFIKEVSQDGMLTLVTEGNENRNSIPLTAVSELTFCYRFIPGKRASVVDFDPANSDWRWTTYCRFMDLTDETASLVLGRPIKLSQLTDSRDWQQIMSATIGL